MHDYDTLVALNRDYIDSVQALEIFLWFSLRPGSASADAAAASAARTATNRKTCDPGHRWNASARL